MPQKKNLQKIIFTFWKRENQREEEKDNSFFNMVS